MRASPRLSTPIRRGSPSSGKIRCCSRAKTPPKQHAPTRRTPSPIGQHWKGSRASTSIGTSSPIRPSPGRSGSFPTTKTTSPSASWRRRFSPPRASTNRPIAAWAAHNCTLRSRTEQLNGERFHALHYLGPGTDLTMGSPTGTNGGRRHDDEEIASPSIPTSRPRKSSRRRMPVASKAMSSAPSALLSRAAADRRHRGTIEAGRIVEAKAARGEDVLMKVLDADEGAPPARRSRARANSSPISQERPHILQYAFDENAACHIAIGQCYSECFVEDGAKLTPDEIAARAATRASSYRLDDRLRTRRHQRPRRGRRRTPIFRQGNRLERRLRARFEPLDGS